MRFQQLIGKTIKTVIEQPGVVQLNFTDDSFLWITPDGVQFLVPNDEGVWKVEEKVG